MHAAGIHKKFENKRVAEQNPRRQQKVFYGCPPKFIFAFEYEFAI